MSILFNIETGIAWGPSKNAPVPVLSLEDVPYSPFSKSDRVGRVADWTEDQNKQDNRGMQAQHQQPHQQYQQNRRYNNRNEPSGAASLFSYQHGDDDASFSLVDSSGKATLPNVNAFRRSMPMRRIQGGGGRGGSRGGGHDGGRGGYDNTGPGARSAWPQGGPQQRGGKQGAAGGGRGNWQNNRGGWQGGGRGQYGAPRVTRESSITIGADWEVVFELELNKLTKITSEVPAEPETLSEHGTLFYYDKSYDRITTKTPKPLVVTDRSKFVNVSTSADSVIQQIAATDSEATIFATDSIMAMLMTCARSVYSWDIVVTRSGGRLYFDRRPGTVDLMSVNENAQETPVETVPEKDNINSVQNLALEATYINSNFSQQVLNFVGERRNMSSGPNPFISHDSNDSDNSRIPSAAFRYRKWHLGNNVYFVARTEIDGITHNTTTGAEVLMSIKTLNEFDPHAVGASSLDWKQKLDVARGAVVATEMKNNGFKAARWAMQAILSGVDILKLGYVSRANPRDVDKHVILGVSQNYRPQDFGSQMNLSLLNTWAVLKVLIDECLRQPDGKYIFVREPNKPVIRLYAVPRGAFDSTQNDDDNGEDDDDL